MRGLIVPSSLLLFLSVACDAGPEKDQSTLPGGTDTGPVLPELCTRYADGDGDGFDETKRVPALHEVAEEADEHTEHAAHRRRREPQAPASI